MDMDVLDLKRPNLTDLEIHLWRGDQPEWLEIIINIIIWIMCIFTVLGNALVIAAFIKFRTIRNKVSNLYILNLSMSDFIIGCVSLSLNNLYRKTGIWHFGEAVCKFWLVVD
jgi:hypothetical protein